MYLLVRVIVCWWTSTVGGPCSLGELVCRLSAFVRGTCLFWDLVSLGTLFIWGLHFSGNLICPRALVFQGPHSSEDIGSFGDLTHPGTLFVPSLCLPGALICPPLWFRHLVLFSTFFDRVPCSFRNLFCGFCSLGHLFKTTYSLKKTWSFRGVHDGDLACSGIFGNTLGSRGRGTV